MNDDRSTRARLEGERLARRYCSSGTAGDLERLVTFYRPMAVALAGRYARGDRRDDLEQVACLGLIKAAKRFDAGLGTTFRSYALPMIIGEVKRFWRDNGWPLHMPRPLQERMLRVRTLAAAFEQRESRPPTVAELAGIVECSAEEIIEALTAEGSANVLSLDGAPARPDEMSLGEQVGGDDPGYDYVDCIESIKSAMARLSRLEREVVRLHFQRELTQRQISQELGIPPRRVGRVLTGALVQLGDTVGVPALA